MMDEQASYPEIRRSVKIILGTDDDDDVHDLNDRDTRDTVHKPSVAEQSSLAGLDTISADEAKLRPRPNSFTHAVRLLYRHKDECDMSSSDASSHSRSGHHNFTIDAGQSYGKDAASAAQAETVNDEVVPGGNVSHATLPSASAWRLPSIRQDARSKNSSSASFRAVHGAVQDEYATKSTRACCTGTCSVSDAADDHSAVLLPASQTTQHTAHPDTRTWFQICCAWGYNMFLMLKHTAGRSVYGARRESQCATQQRYSLNGQAPAATKQARTNLGIANIVFAVTAFLMGAVAVILSALAYDHSYQTQRTVSSESKKDDAPATAGESGRPNSAFGESAFVHVSRIAFGSKYQRGSGPNSIWQQAVIPAKPDAWIWTGNMAYFPEGLLNCSDPANLQAADCNCLPTHIREPPLRCFAASVSNAEQQMEQMLSTTGYAEFLDYMCPGYYSKNAAVPPGTDPQSCPRPILGIYGDNDYGWTMGDRRMPSKNDIKEIFLDALGVPRGNVQHRRTRGAYQHVSLASGTGDSLDVITLDERYHRAPLPCHQRRQHCMLPQHANTAWCIDFLGNETVANPGSCCKQDDDIAEGWCEAAASERDYRFREACQPWSAEYGSQKFGLDDVGSFAAEPISTWRNAGDSSGFCDVLGRAQRLWLQRTVQESSASVKLVVAPSGLLGNPFLSNSAGNDYAGGCDNDWDCYRPAQVNLLHTLANSTGCVVVLSGDAPYADFKAVRASSVLPYAEPYKAQYLNKSVYQATVTGMHPSTAPGVDKSCGGPCCGRTIDSSGLRIGGVCAVYGEPSFGMITVDWSSRVLKMQILKADGSGVAVTDPGPAPSALGTSVAMELDIDLRFCLNKA